MNEPKRDWTAYDPTLGDLRSKISGLHFGQESLSSAERDILHLAERALWAADWNWQSYQNALQKLMRTGGVVRPTGKRLLAGEGGCELRYENPDSAKPFVTREDYFETKIVGDTADLNSEKPRG